MAICSIPPIPAPIPAGFIPSRIAASGPRIATFDMFEALKLPPLLGIPNITGLPSSPSTGASGSGSTTGSGSGSLKYRISGANPARGSWPCAILALASAVNSSVVTALGGRTRACASSAFLLFIPGRLGIFMPANI